MSATQRTGTRNQSGDEAGDENSVDSRDHDWIMTRVEELIASGDTEPRPARDAVNVPMINNWTEAIGDDDPRYRPTAAGGPVAPPAMAQVWTMYGLDPRRPENDPLHGAMGVFDEAGFTSVLGTNCDQTYARLLRPGDHPAITTRLESVVGPKHTAVGEGYFVTTRNTWWVGEGADREAVATMVFRVLKYRPGSRRPAVDRTNVVRPVLNRDNAFFYEGTAAGEIRIQRCEACGVLRHPPGPFCPGCHATDRGYVVAGGRGHVHSWLVHHAPQVPGKELPLRLGLVELDEGVRMVGELRGHGAERLDIGDRVEVAFDRIDDDLTLPYWRPVAQEGLDTSSPRGSDGSTTEGVLRGRAERSFGGRAERSFRGRAERSFGDRAASASERVETETPETSEALPAWELPVTTTLVVSTALATRDFQDVHHDRDLAVQRGSKDIFLNILTTTGLVQRYVGEWARGAGHHDARVLSCALRLGAPAHPGDTLALSGTAYDAPPDPDEPETGGRVVTVDVTGTVPLGQHVTARLRVALGNTAEEAR